MDFTAVDKRIAALEATRAKPCKVSPTEPLAVGLDLGTAYIVLAVVDSRQRPVACAVQSAQVVRDGLVVDYAGGLRMVRALREQLEDSLGRKLEKTAIAVPPGTGERDCATHRHVAEGAGLEVTALLDEPTAANNVLGVRHYRHCRAARRPSDLCGGRTHGRHAPFPGAGRQLRCGL